MGVSYKIVETYQDVERGKSALSSVQLSSSTFKPHKNKSRRLKPPPKNISEHRVTTDTRIGIYHTRSSTVGMTTTFLGCRVLLQVPVHVAAPISFYTQTQTHTRAGGYASPCAASFLASQQLLHFRVVPSMGDPQSVKEERRLGQDQRLFVKKRRD